MEQSETSRRQVKLAYRNGLHLTPIQLLVKSISPFMADVRIHFDGRVASAKSAMDLMLLGATFGAELMVEANGSDADGAVAKVAEILGEAAD
ncbi:MAG: HPr family phosphocarrier protein [Planctomycetaceae bacterium]